MLISQESTQSGVKRKIDEMINSNRKTLHMKPKTEEYKQQTI